MNKISHDTLLAWQQLLHGLGKPAFIIDASQNCLVANDAMRSMVPESVLAVGLKEVYDFLFPQETNKHLQSDNDVFAGSGPLNFSGLYMEKTGAIKVVGVHKAPLHGGDGEILALLTTLEDQTAHETLRQTLSSSEAEKQAIVTGYPGMMALFGADEQLIWANDNFSSFFHSPSSSSFADHFSDDDNQCHVYHLLEEALSGQESTTTKKIVRGGVDVYLDLVVTPVRNGAGTVTSAILFCYDVTEKFSLEKQLRHAQKMEAIGTLAGGIAHDFNNVLTPIMGYSEIIRMNLKQVAGVAPEVNDYLGEILRASRRAKSLVEQILTFSRSSEQRESLQYVHPIVKEVMKLMRKTLPTTIRIVEEIDEGCGLVMADPVLLHQVLMNLCTNSYQAITSEHGEIRVSLQKAAEQFDDTSWVELRVEDNGGGIEPENLERIFEPYFTTKEKEQGTGMGLAMVHGIIERQGGRVEVTSVVGEGTVFHIFLPAAKELSTRRDHIISSEEIVTGTGHILLVDDDAQVVRVTGDLLKNLGYEVTGMTSPLSALSLMDEQPENDFSLVITDLTMPDLNGLQLTERIKKKQPEVPVILFSGYSEQFSKEAAEKAGVDAYCLKPLSLKDISTVVSRVMRG